MEDLRERMRIETGLIVVGSADNNLIVSKKKRREEGITQSIVDRCIIVCFKCFSTPKIVNIFQFVE